jgi:hypothetical protein
MNLKTNLAISFLLMLLPSFTDSETEDTTEPEKEIELIGALPTSLLKSTSCPVLCHIGHNQVQADFKKSMGVVDMFVQSSTKQTVWEQSVNTFVTTDAVIDITDWEPGIYQIRFVNAGGCNLYGEFKIE